MSLPPRAAFGRQMWPSVCAKAVWLRASAHLVVFGLPFDAPQPTRGNPGWCVACSAANRDGSSRCHGPDAIDVAAVEGTAAAEEGEALSAAFSPCRANATLAAQQCLIIAGALAVLLLPATVVGEVSRRPKLTEMQ